MLWFFFFFELEKMALNFQVAIKMRKSLYKLKTRYKNTKSRHIKMKLAIKNEKSLYKNETRYKKQKVAIKK